MRGDGTRGWGLVAPALLWTAAFFLVPFALMAAMSLARLEGRDLIWSLDWGNYARLADYRPAQAPRIAFAELARQVQHRLPVACPAFGYAEVSLGGSVAVDAGDWFYIGGDNTAVQFKGMAPGGGALFNGSLCEAESAFPAPDPAPAMNATTNRSFVLVGVA